MPDVRLIDVLHRQMRLKSLSGEGTNGHQAESPSGDLGACSKKHFDYKFFLTLRRGKLKMFLMPGLLN